MMSPHPHMPLRSDTPRVVFVAWGKRGISPSLVWSEYYSTTFSYILTLRQNRFHITGFTYKRVIHILRHQFSDHFQPPSPLVIERHQAPNPPPPNITSSVNMLISIPRSASNCCKSNISISYVNECLSTESMELKQTVNNAIIYAN